MAALSGEVAVHLDADGRDAKWPERRKRVRMEVHWPVRFLRRGGIEAQETITNDLSSEGFRCMSRVAFAPGETSLCTLGVPTYDPKDAGRVLPVICKVRVVWVVSADNGAYHIGCRIENYRFVDRIPSDQEFA